MPTLSLQQTIEIGNKASAYARSQILQGTTQLENNDLPPDYVKAHYVGLDIVRNSVICKTKTPDSTDALWLPPAVVRFKNSIAFTSKYSIGNCGELAYQTLDYLIKYGPLDLNGEYYTIFGGDHAFVVLNRDPASDPQNPATWGNNAVICDAWSNNVFPAKEYRFKLKNFYRSTGNAFFDKLSCYSRGKVKNCVEPFSPPKHRLEPLKHDAKTIVSSNWIRQCNQDQTAIKTRFAELLQCLLRDLTHYIKNLEKEKNRLQNKYGDNDFKYTLILNKMTATEELIQTIKAKASLGSKPYPNASEAKAELETVIRDLFSRVNNVKFNEDEQKELYQHRRTDTLTEAMKFFGLNSRTQSNVKALIDNMSHLAKHLDQFARKK